VLTLGLGGRNRPDGHKGLSEALRIGPRRSSSGSRAIKHGAVDIGAAIGRGDPGGMQATGPKGSYGNPCVKRSGTTLGLLESERPKAGRL
jgi:hypothetical protein